MITNLTEHVPGLYSAECNLDLVALKCSTREIEEIVKKSFKASKSDYRGQSTTTTKLYSKYNFCLYPLPMINELYWTIHQMFHTCLTEFHKGRVENKFVMQSWLNVYQKGEFIDWHSHTDTAIGGWHGFYCLNTEPESSTYYKWENDPSKTQIEIKSKNNLIVIGATNGDKHKSSVWTEEEPRITIAFDILPADKVYENSQRMYGSYIKAMRKNACYVNHWIPM